jgi:RNA polymerase sigma factor (sigma-70 family)
MLTSVASLLLLERARAGDNAALDELLGRLLPRLRRWATGRLPRAARDLLDTEDVVQETLVKAVRNFDRIEIRDDGAFHAYLREALTRRLIDAYRASRPRANDTDVKSDQPANQPSPLEEAIGAEALRRYEAALARLKPSDRSLVILRIELSYEYDEIAHMTGKTGAASARMAVSRALRRLSKEMSRVA